MAQKSWPSGAPSRGGGRCIAVMPGHHRDVERAPGGLAGLDRLEHGRRHGEHARIAARDDSDRAALGGERSAWRARSISSRLSQAWRAWSGR